MCTYSLGSGEVCLIVCDNISTDCPTSEIKKCWRHGPEPEWEERTNAYLPHEHNKISRANAELLGNLLLVLF